MFDLTGRVAFISGASRGIGHAVALRLADRGAAVVVAARSVDALEALAEEIRARGGEAYPMALDLAQPGTIGDRLAELPERFSSVDIVVSNAGITRDGLLARMSLEQWNDVLDVNLTAGFALSRHFVRGMMRKRHGRFIFISSVVGLVGNAGQANYAAAKAGLHGLTKALARELGSRGITANAIAPGYIETAMTEALDERARKALTDGVPAGRLGSVDDVAAAVVYLASDEASYVTGTVLNVSGGMAM